MSAPTLTAHGLRVRLPDGWEARAYRRDTPTRTYPAATPDAARDGPVPTHAAASAALRAGGPGWHGERPHAVLHLANFALPPGRGDFGTGAVERMGAGHLFVCLFEYDVEEAGRPLFAARGLPVPHHHEFSPNALQQRLAGQAGWQRFCTVHGRPFCVYVVLGSAARARTLAPHAATVLSRTEVLAS